MPRNILIFKAGISDEKVNTFIGWMNAQISAGIDNLEIAISSPGGNVVQGIAMVNFIQSLPFNVTAHNIGQVDSIAIPIFAACHNRRANQFSQFTFHGSGLTYEGRMEEAKLKELYETIQSHNAVISDIIANYTDIPLDQCRRLIERETVKTPAWAVENNLVDDIVEFKIEPGDNVMNLV